MKRLIEILILVSGVFLLTQAVLALELGEVAPRVELKKNWGGGWTENPGAARSCRERFLSSSMSTRMKRIPTTRPAKPWRKEKFPTDKFHLYGMINMAATWLPNFAINSALEEKQKKYPRTIYVRDYKKVLVQA